MDISTFNVLAGCTLTIVGAVMLNYQKRILDKMDNMDKLVTEHETKIITLERKVEKVEDHLYNLQVKPLK